MTEKSPCHRAIAFVCITGVVCGIYYKILVSIITPTPIDVLVKSMNENIEKITNQVFESESKCDLNWRNPYVNDEYYEYAVHDETMVKQKNLELPIKPLYRNPVIRLDPEKFMLPIVYNGPNNQITGLREAAFVAIRLNRTLVIPKFFKHFSDSSVTGSHTTIFPGHRFDIEKFCKFVSCVTIEQFRTACGYQVDTFFNLQKITLQDIQMWKKYLGMMIPWIVRQYGLAGVNLVPAKPLPSNKKARKFTSVEVKYLFTTKDKCTIYPRPLYNLHVPKRGAVKHNQNITLVKAQKDLEVVSDPDLYLSIINALGNPEYIKEIARKFVENVIKKKPFVSVHWRYNKGDFMKRCRSGTGNKVKMDLCTNALQIKPEDIARSIEMKIETLRETADTNIGNVYIATPLSERGFVSRIAKILYVKHSWLTYSSLDLEEYLYERHGSCEALKKHFNDIVSTTEMEICGLGVAFLGSARSSWTANVDLARKTANQNIRREEDDDIFKMASAFMNERKRKNGTLTS